MLKERMQERIESIINYMESDSACRQQMLMAYFGEKAPRCGHCDVCLDNKHNYNADEADDNNTDAAGDYNTDEADDSEAHSVSEDTPHYKPISAYNTAYKKNYEMFLSLIGDGKKHLIADIQKVNIPTEILRDIINYLRAENMIETDGVYLQLCKQ